MRPTTTVLSSAAGLLGVTVLISLMKVKAFMSLYFKFLSKVRNFYQTNIRHSYVLRLSLLKPQAHILALSWLSHYHLILRQTTFPHGLYFRQLTIPQNVILHITPRNRLKVYGEHTFFLPVPSVALQLDMLAQEMRSDSMMLRWRPYTCQESRGYLQHYLLTYCRANDGCTHGKYSLRCSSQGNEV